MVFLLRSRPYGLQDGTTLFTDGDCMLKNWMILLITILVTGCGCQAVKNKTDVSTVENDIRAHLPIGSSKADVTAYLDSAVEARFLHLNDVRRWVVFER